MIKTRHGLRFVDKAANISPGFWKFFGDLGIVLSFGGMGGYYVSRYRNTWKIAAVLGTAALAFTYTVFGFLPAVAGLSVLVIGVLILRRVSNPLLHTIASAILVGGIMFSIYPIFSGMGIFRIFVSVLVGLFGVPALLVSMLFIQAADIVIGRTTTPGVSPLLPTVSEQGAGFFFPGTGIFIPIWEALIAIIVLLVPHEFSHGILTRCHKIKLKTAGLLTVGPVPIGAFVEPDDKDMRKHENRERMRIYSAGSFTNIIVALLAVIIITFVMAPVASNMTYPSGMLITNVVNGSPADGVLESGYLIKEINGVETPDVETFLESLSEAVGNAREYLREAMKAGASRVLGHGSGPLCHLWLARQ